MQFVVVFLLCERVSKHDLFSTFHGRTFLRSGLVQVVEKKIVFKVHVFKPFSDQPGLHSGPALFQCTVKGKLYRDASKR